MGEKERDRTSGTDGEGRGGGGGVRRICLEQRLRGTDGISRLAFAGNTPSSSLSFFLGPTTMTTTYRTRRASLKHNGACFSVLSPADNAVYLTSFKSTKPVN